MNVVIEKLKTAARAQEAGALQAYRAAVARAADGKGKTDELLVVCDAAGKGIAEFEDDVSRLVRRRTDAAALATQPDIEGRRAKVAAELGALVAEREAVLKDFADREAAIRTRLAATDDELRGVNDARVRLIKTADPKLDMDCQFAASAVAREREEAERLGRELDRVRAVADQEPKPIPTAPGDKQLVAPRQEFNANVDRYRQRAEYLKGRIADVKARISQLREDERKAEAAKLVP